MSCTPAEPFLDAIRTRSLIRQTTQTERHLKNGEAHALSFSDNDYLGLTHHPRVMEAAQNSIQDHGTGARAARLLAPPFPEYEKLEKSLAGWKSTERALLFSAGYLAPLGVIPALAGSQDTVVIERNAHACLFDGARLSNAKIRLFDRHNPTDLSKVLMLTRKLNPQGKILIVAESLHSMDGDLLPLAEIVRWKEEFAAWLLLDEAHAGGLYGPKGSGWAAELGLAGRIEIQMGTMGKALGSSGGFVAASDEIIRHLVNEARTFLFGTALAPASTAAAYAALEIIQSHEGEQLRTKLRENIKTFRSQRLTPLTGPIQSIPCSTNQASLDIFQRLLDNGVHVPAIRPPTVPEGTARLRISLSSRHASEGITKLCQILNHLLPIS
jgi:8-amino-7-oxononanoate synthase